MSEVIYAVNGAEITINFKNKYSFKVVTHMGVMFNGPIKNGAKPIKMEVFEYRPIDKWASIEVVTPIEAPVRYIGTFNPHYNVIKLLENHNFKTTCKRIGESEVIEYKHTINLGEETLQVTYELDRSSEDYRNPLNLKIETFTTPIRCKYVEF